MTDKKSRKIFIARNGKVANPISYEELERRLEEKEYPEAVELFEQIALKMSEQSGGKPVNHP